jgi:hypothetical protein
MLNATLQNGLAAHAIGAKPKRSGPRDIERVARVGTVQRVSRLAAARARRSS